MSTVKKSPSKKKTGKTAAAKGGRKWSADVTKHSDALDLKKGVFTSDSPKKIAQSLEKSAEQSDRKKGSAEQSAMSMLNFYINRAGKNLPAEKKKTLTKAKDELKALHEKEPGGRKQGESHKPAKKVGVHKPGKK